MFKFTLVLWVFWLVMSFMAGTSSFLAMLIAHFLLVVWLFLPEPNFVALLLGRTIVESLRGGTYDEEQQRKIGEMQDKQARNERVSWWLVLVNNIVMGLAFMAAIVSMYLIYASLPR